MEQKKFGAFICELRKEKDLTQKQLGELLHISDKAISKWERGISCPDIEMLGKLADVFDVSLLELIQGKKSKKEVVPFNEAEEALADGMEQAMIQKKQVKHKYVFLLILVIVCAYPFISFLKWGINQCLDGISDLVETSYHKADYVLNGNSLPDASYYVYRAQMDDDIWEYRVVGINAQGERQTIYTVQETGMDMDRAPKLLQSENSLFLLFEGLDNEDPVERVYDESIGADPQGFLPCLYRYDMQTHVVDKIDIEQSTQTMLADAFIHQGEVYYIGESFRGLIGDLHLGFYVGDQMVCNGKKSISFENIWGDGGMKATGCVTAEGMYYIAGRNGIYGINLTTGEGEYAQTLDLRKCYRSEIHSYQTADGDVGYAVATTVVDQTNSYGEPQAVHTDIRCYDAEWKIVNEIIVNAGMSAMEWGDKSAMLTGEEGKCYYVDLIRGTTSSIEDINIPSTSTQRQLDSMEEEPAQWVYVRSCKQYYYTGNESWYMEK